MSILSYIVPLQILKVSSPLNGEIKITENLGRKTLYINDTEQSGGTITGMWEKTIRNVKHSMFDIRSCLILGLGGGTLITLLNKYYPGIKITVIEFDPMIIDIAAKYFGIVASPDLAIIHADAFSWIKNNKTKFDTVIFDIYWGKFNPPKSRTPGFLKDLKRLLNNSGFVLYNSHYQNDDEEFQKFFRICQKVFPQAELILPYPYSRILKLR